MPILGLGTWKSPVQSVGQAVEYAITKANYPHIDCAHIYRNEPEIGEALQKVWQNGKQKRADIFITSKLWNSDHERERVRPACETTLKNLKLDYLDLYLMHWGIATYPDPEANINGRFNEKLDANGMLIPKKVSIRETWEAMEQLVTDGLVRAIGVANFTAPMLVDLLSYAKIKPAVNQIELHPYLQQNELITFCKNNGIAVTAYSPLGSPGNYSNANLVQDETIIAIAKAHHKAPAQILIRWAIQRQTIVIPKSVTPERIQENINVFDFQLSESEMQKIAGLNRNQRFVNPIDWWKIPYFG
jgi:diketogulonate reductase-like aldo/keto reductase